MLVSLNHSEVVETLAEMHRHCFEKGWSVSEIKALLDLSTTRLWLIPQGFLLCSQVVGEMEILTIGILPEFRKQGYGLSLLQEMKQYAETNQIERVFLEVAQDNQAAQALYAKVGFQQIGIRAQYYQTAHGPVDALCLGLQIQKR